MAPDPSPTDPTEPTDPSDVPDVVPSDRSRADEESVNHESVSHVISGPGMLLSVVPQLLGFHPERSLVFVLLAGRRVVATARYDLPNREELAMVWPSLSAVVAQAGADAALLVGYAASDAASDADSDVDSLLVRCAATAPVPVLDVSRVDAGRWWSLTCTDPTCCPPGAVIPDHESRGRPHELSVPLAVLAGSAVAPSRRSLAEALAPAPAAVRARVAAHLDHLTRSSSDSSADSSSGAWSAADRYAVLDQARRDRLARPVPVTELDAARLLHALTNPTTPTGTTGTTGASDTAVRDACCGWTDQDAAWWLWMDLMPLAPASHVPVVASLIAVAAYSRGDGAMAVIAAQHALDAAPDYALAQLLLDLAQVAIAPDTFNAGLRRAAANALTTLLNAPGLTADDG